MQHQFHVAQQQLAYERNEMHSMEEDDRVKALEQKTKMQRMAAHRQAQQYEQHLRALTDSVFPSEVRIVQPLILPPPSLGKLLKLFDRCPSREKTMRLNAPNPPKTHMDGDPPPRSRRESTTSVASSTGPYSGPNPEPTP